jgi:hypothetical protein
MKYAAMNSPQYPDIRTWLKFFRRSLPAVFLTSLAEMSVSAQTPPAPAAAAASSAVVQAGEMRHSYASFGAFTGIVSESGEVVWKYPASTRDGWVLPNGDILLTLSKGRDYPGGGVVLVNRDNKILFEFKGTQSEVNTAQMLENGNILLTEAGAKPRILEVERSGNIAVEVPIQTTVTNHHMQSRMTRKLPNGNYLVPQLLDRVVREYTPKGEIAWEYKTPEEPRECWPFTAIRIPNGNTVINLTHGNGVVVVDPKGEVVWRVSNADFPEAPFKDPCGAQWLPNGNIVVTSYAAKGDALKLFEINADKKIVWSLRDGKPHGLHEFQILTTNGKDLPHPAFR